MRKKKTHRRKTVKKYTPKNKLSPTLKVIEKAEARKNKKRLKIKKFKRKTVKVKSKRYTKTLKTQIPRQKITKTLKTKRPKGNYYYEKIVTNKGHIFYLKYKNQARRQIILNKLYTYYDFEDFTTQKFNKKEYRTFRQIDPKFLKKLKARGYA